MAFADALAFVSLISWPRRTSDQRCPMAMCSSLRTEWPLRIAVLALARMIVAKPVLAPSMPRLAPLVIILPALSDVILRD